MRIGLLSAAALLSALIPPAGATDIYFPNRRAESSDGRYRLTATSPDNTPDHSGRTKPGARHFTYRLIEAESEHVCWSFQQQERDGSPLAIFVNNGRWVVLRLCGEVLQVRAPDTGALLYSFRLLEQLSPEERTAYVHETSALPMWAGCSSWRFETLEDQRCFVVRAWWGRRVIIDLQGAQLMPDEGELRAVLDAADRRFVVETLQRAVSLDVVEELRCGAAHFRNLDAAVTIAGQMKVTEAIPLLRQLEGRRCSAGYWSGSWTQDASHAGAIDPMQHRYFTLRQEIQLALRRLDEPPACYAATQFFREQAGGGVGSTVAVKSPFPDRVEGVASLALGMSPDEVLERIGAPDLLARRSVPSQLAPGLTVRSWSTSAWEYDMDATPPYTLRIQWTQDGRVAAVQVVTPPVWQEPNTRDAQYCGLCMW